MIYIQQRAVIVVEIRTWLRMEATGPQTLATNLPVLAMHSVHIGGRPSEIGDISLEIRHSRNAAHLVENRLLTPRGYEFALMSRYGAKRASTETASVKVHRMTNHLISRYAFAFIAWMWHTRISHVKRTVYFLGRHRRVHRVDLNRPAPVHLPQCRPLETV